MADFKINYGSPAAITGTFLIPSTPAYIRSRYKTGKKTIDDHQIEQDLRDMIKEWE